jgi:tRNA pseudouridine55 synthase
MTKLEKYTKSGLLLLDKPVGPTSHDVVSWVRRALGIKRIGHTGTLDPFASGLLILCVGKATRLSEYYLHKEKTYQFQMTLGATSDTYDRTGNIIYSTGPHQSEDVKKKQVLDLLNEFIGEISQIPPIYSGIKVKGKRLYEYARAGEEVEVKPRKVFIRELNLVKFNPPRLSMVARVSSGTYIRSLGHDIGQRLGVGAYLSSLRRTAIGSLKVESATSLGALIHGGIESAWLSIKDAFSDWNQVVLEGENLRRIENGNPIDAYGLIPIPPENPQEPLLLLNQVGEVVCVAILKLITSGEGSWTIQPIKVLHSG